MICHAHFSGRPFGIRRAARPSSACARITGLHQAFFDSSIPYISVVAGFQIDTLMSYCELRYPPAGTVRRAVALECAARAFTQGNT
jgi:hypothetical protein